MKNCLIIFINTIRIKQLIKNDEYREKLVNEGKLVIEDNITRKLKKKVNNDGKKK